MDEYNKFRRVLEILGLTKALWELGAAFETWALINLYLGPAITVLRNVGLGEPKNICSFGAHSS
jgi:hypothetical protein